MTLAGARDARTEADFQLAQRCSLGDPGAQRKLFADYKSLVHSTLYRLLGSNRDMEDLVQDAFLEIFRSLERFRGDARLSTWVSRITARVAYAHMSRRRPTHASLEVVPETASSDPSVESQTASRQATRRLYAALERLDPKHRIAFALHVIDGRPLREVADITESTLVATKSRVWRARRDLYKRAKKDPLLASYLAEEVVS